MEAYNAEKNENLAMMKREGTKKKGNVEIDFELSAKKSEVKIRRS